MPPASAPTTRSPTLCSATPPRAIATRAAGPSPRLVHRRPVLLPPPNSTAPPRSSTRSARAWGCRSATSPRAICSSRSRRPGAWPGFPPACGPPFVIISSTRRPRSRATITEPDGIRHSCPPGWCPWAAAERAWRVIPVCCSKADQLAFRRCLSGRGSLSTRVEARPWIKQTTPPAGDGGHWREGAGSGCAGRRRQEKE